MREEKIRENDDTFGFWEDGTYSSRSGPYGLRAVSPGIMLLLVLG